MSDNPHIDTLVIGAGPIGLEVAATLQQAGQVVSVVDAGCVGNTIARQFPSHTRFFSSPERLEIAGQHLAPLHEEKPTGEAYLAYLRSVICTLGLDVHTFHRVTDSAHNEEGWHVTTRTPSGMDRIWHAAAVVLATGGTQRHRTLNVPGEDLPHVHRTLGDPHRFFQRRVLVVGGRNSAAESALRLWRASGHVTLSYRGPEVHDRVKYWIRPELCALIDEGLINGQMNTIVERIEPDAVTLRHLHHDSITTIPVDDVLLQLGFEQDSSLLRQFGVTVDDATQQPSFDEHTMRTDGPDVYVAGTASAGTQGRFTVYIETSHVHADRICAAITGTSPPPTRTPRLLPES
ncbi:MAG: NAD(P)-binding domain-containing protein [Phycisphaerales bacterium]|nr:NAD(P)-binding domain-containing protein [Phycisphaerales bacterium]